METGEGLNCVKDHIYVAQKGVKLHDNDQETQEDDNMEIVVFGVNARPAVAAETPSTHVGREAPTPLGRETRSPPNGQYVTTPHLIFSFAVVAVEKNFNDL